MIKVTYNGEELTYKRWVFPGGEVGVKFDNLEKTYYHHYIVIAVMHQTITAEDQLVIINLINALNENGYTNINLYMHYFPYARQDRVCNKGESFGLKVFLNMLNTVNFSCLYTFDVHNFDAMLKLTASLKCRYHDFNSGYFLIRLRDEGYLDSDTTIVLPDKGATKKLTDPNMIFDKVRNVETGQITGMEIIHDESDVSEEYLVIDDICEGGRTFIELAKLFKEVKGKETQINLYVTHGIFSNNAVEKLLDFYSKIYVNFMKESDYYKLTDSQQDNVFVNTLINA